MKRSLCKVYFKEQVRFSTHTHTHKDEKRINRDWAKKPSIFPIIQGGGNFKFNSLLWSIQRIERGFFLKCICSELIVNVYLLLGNYTKCVLAEY